MVENRRTVLVNARAKRGVILMCAEVCRNHATELLLATTTTVQTISDCYVPTGSSTQEIMPSNHKSTLITIRAIFAE